MGLGTAVRGALLFGALLCLPGTGAAEEAAKAPVKPSADGVVVMEVTSEGFVPQDVRLEKGKPVKLRITRRTEKTCAKQVVVPGLVTATELPLDQQVEVAFTPTKTGKLRYGCAMEQMVGGTLLVE